MIDSISLLLENLVNYNCLFLFFFSKSIDHLHDDDIKSQDVIESDEDLLFNENTFKELTKYKSREVQTKLFAILLPQSPLSEMKTAKIEERTLMNVTRTCQVNTLSYLIKTNENQTDLPRMDCSSSTSFLRTESQLIEELSTKENNLSTKMQHQTLTDHKYDAQGINIPIIQFDEEQSKESIFTLSTLKCINACDKVDLDERNTSITSFLTDNDRITRSASSDQQDNKYGPPILTIDDNILVK